MSWHISPKSSSSLCLSPLQITSYFNYRACGFTINTCLEIFLKHSRSFNKTNRWSEGISTILKDSSTLTTWRKQILSLLNNKRRLITCFSVTAVFPGPGSQKLYLFLYDTRKIQTLILYENIKYWKVIIMTDNKCYCFTSHCTHWAGDMSFPAIVFVWFRKSGKQVTFFCCTADKIIIRSRWFDETLSILETSWEQQKVVLNNKILSGIYSLGILDANICVVMVTS